MNFIRRANGRESDMVKALVAYVKKQAADISGMDLEGLWSLAEEFGTTEVGQGGYGDGPYVAKIVLKNLPTKSYLNVKGEGRTKEAALYDAIQQAIRVSSAYGVEVAIDVTGSVG